MSDSRVAVIVPVKPPSIGKSRLDLPDDRRAAYAHAFALDTITAALATPAVAHVLVVTDDHHFAAAVQRLGCAVIPDGVSGDLNASLEQAAHEAARRWPDHHLAVLCADVPALQPDDLDQALRLARTGDSAFVRDAAGTGTSLYVAASVDLFAPRFGVGSADAHQEGGASEVSGELASLRQDVDDTADLAKALAFGVGPHTAAALLGS